MISNVPPFIDLPRYFQMKEPPTTC